MPGPIATPLPYRAGGHAPFAPNPVRDAARPLALWVYVCACGRYYTAHGLPARCVCGEPPGAMALVAVCPRALAPQPPADPGGGQPGR